MRKIFLYIMPAMICLYLLNGCKKSFSDQQSIPQQPAQPDLTARILLTVSGFVTDENGNAVFNASVTADTKTANTDEYGFFKISNVSLSKTAGFVKISKAGYFDGYRTFVGIENKETFIRLKLIPKTTIGTISASSGGTVNTSDGAIVSLPANAVVVASNNASYSGTIHVAAHLFKQDNIGEWAATIPGDQRGIDAEGKLKMMKSYCMLAVELTGDAGELLQIAASKEATITIPIPSALLSSAPASIPLWSFDISKGLWKQESSTVKNGNNYIGNVSHFSFWDGAVGVPLVNLTAQIVNSALQPLANVWVGVRYASTPYNTGAGYGYAYTNAQGIVSGAVFANENLMLDVLTTCALPAYSHPFTTGSVDIDLGTITGDLGQNMVTIIGTAKDCSNAPVTDGYIQFYNGYYNNRIYISNGTFSYTGVRCTNVTANYVAVDNNANQQSTPQSITLVPGVNNLGNLSACGTSTLTFISYSVDGGPPQNIADTINSVVLWGLYDSTSPTNGNETLIASLGASQNLRPHMQFSMTGDNVIGDSHTTRDLFSIAFPSGRAQPNGTPLTVTITEYGNIGGFITGSFSGTVEDWGNHIPHTISCSFRVRRNQ